MLRSVGACLAGLAFVLGGCSSSGNDPGDEFGPTVTIDQSQGQVDPTNAVQIEFTAVFSEPVTGFTSADLTYAGSTVGGTLDAVVSTIDATTYSVVVFGMAGSGTLAVGVKAGAARDGNGNPSEASTSVDNTVAWTDDPPTVAVNQAPAQADPVNTGPIQMAVEFSEPVTGFTGADVSFAGSTAPGTLVAQVTGAGASYTVGVTGMTGSGEVVVNLPGGAATDAGGNPSLASTSIDNTVAYDVTRPGVTIDQAVAQADPATGDIRFTAQFSEPVNGFAAADVSLTGTTVGGTLSVAVVGNGGGNYTVTVSGMTTNGIVVVGIPANAATDGAGNLSTASTSIDNTVTWQNSPPTVTIVQNLGQVDPINHGPIQFGVHFSEPVTGFVSGDVSLSGSTAGGTLVATVTGTGQDYLVSVTGMTTGGIVVASVPAGVAADAGGLANQASTSVDNTVTFDPVGPSVTVDQAPGQADPTAGATIQFAVHFSEAVTGLVPTDVSFAGSSVGGTLAAAITGAGANYTISVTGMSGAGTVVVNLPAGAANDLAGNPSLASTSIDNAVTH